MKTGYFFTDVPFPGTSVKLGEGKPGEETGWFRDKEGKTTDKGGKPPKRVEMKNGGKMVG